MNELYIYSLTICRQVKGQGFSFSWTRAGGAGTSLELCLPQPKHRLQPWQLARFGALPVSFCR